MVLLLLSAAISSVCLFVYLLLFVFRTPIVYINITPVNQTPSKVTSVVQPVLKLHEVTHFTLPYPVCYREAVVYVGVKRMEDKNTCKRNVDHC